MFNVNFSDGDCKIMTFTKGVMSKKTAFHCFHFCHLPCHVVPAQVDSFAKKKLGGRRKCGGAAAHCAPLCTVTPWRPPDSGRRQGAPGGARGDWATPNSKISDKTAVYWLQIMF